MEILKDIFIGLIVLITFVSAAWAFIFNKVKGMKGKKWFIFINIALFLFYMGYFHCGRYNKSEYGAALVWESYLLVIPIIHTFILLITALVVRRFPVSKNE